MLKRRDTKEIVQDVVDTIKEPIKKSKKLQINKTVSTGSTLLDLNISGKRTRYGGIPGGIIMELYGPSSSGKTAILSEVCASAQSKKGAVKFLDPEARLDKEYAAIYGVSLKADDYSRPDTVTEVFQAINEWSPEREDVINVIATDSLAALSTNLELEKGDKMGMRRAKEFSEGFRKTARLITNNNWLIACTNQVREGDYGEVTPGGQAIPFYSSLRIRVSQINKVDKKTKLHGKEVKKIIGIESSCFIRKSSIDEPFRECHIYIIFGYGIDDIRGNLQYIKDTLNLTTYRCPDGKTYQGMEAAIRYVEETALQERLKEEVVDLWNEVEDKLKVERIPKKR